MAQMFFRSTHPWQLWKPLRLLALSGLSWAAMTVAIAAQVPPTGETSALPGVRISRPVLTLGSQGDAVSELQAVLFLLGYYTSDITGNYQEPTQAAVQRFQQAAGLTPDGIVGPATWSSLFPTPAAEANPPVAATPQPQPAQPPAATPPAAETPAPDPTPETAPVADPTPSLPVLKLGDRGDGVLALQRRLQALDFYQGPLDGVFGPQTERAVKAAQNFYELTADGIVGPATWQALDISTL